MKKILSFTFVLLSVSLLIFISKEKSISDGVTVDTHVVSEDQINETILASGNLRFASEIQIRSEVTGIVNRVYVKEGQLVKKGELLMELDPKIFIAEVRRSHAAVEIQLIEIQRLEEIANEAARRAGQYLKLLGQGLTDQDTAAQLQSQLKVARINVKAAIQGLEQYKAILAQSQNRLDQSRFLAAIDGLISTVDIKEGETVIVGTTNIVGSPLMTLADVDSYVAQIRVDEADVSNIEIGQEVEIFAAATPQIASLGQISSISTSAKKDSVNKGLYYKVEVTLQKGQLVYPGMSCRAEIVLARSGIELIIPIAAVKQLDGVNFVWVVEDNKAVKRDIQLGLSTDTEQIVLSGLAHKELVIVGPSRQVKALKNGTEVEHKESYHASI
ncbi:efflux RND transporter periplasmic adaptor subunit [Shewanella sp. D64]|uniref:efflux RND transporter periplasmic adaptor subunit n=1 Tax=unclassified Shewanella TaxID=196818 RepID=UPI0022BA71F7|nr:MULTISPECIES: efflux RND transporter periplasmic adaptor subunit [unclassified Shewanella]MEC4726305.1 efflux RND transporter periplasmic adaptor subunit [Shewanella sp. D64]MEC4738317.1 efflux RND transporter periplasmic adaptor subunit [Shewanella sp. E94]WBJ95452.1 efflux RND transporter periplasmic adaptor subunit [Shewanella sp. MTB7]